MTVTAPPRPPRPSDPMDREEFEALVEALIEEARQRAQRRRRRNAAVVTLIAFVGAALFALLGRTAQSQTASPTAARSSLPAATASRIAFFAGFYPTELYVMNADGSGKRSLVRHSSGLGPDPYGGPVWSPDGLKLAFAKRLAPAIGQCQVCHHEIFVMNADGSGQRNLTGNLGGDAAAWSPDSQQIAFSRTIASTPNLYVMNADGSGQRRVTQDAINVWGASWSPDGRQLAFSSGVGNPGNFNIYVVNVDGSGQQQLTTNRGQAPAWSPDGQTIAFARYVRTKVGGYRGWQKELHVMNADGSEQRKLTPLSTAGDGSYAWSPDGRRIAFVSYRDGNDEVYVINVDGSGLRNLTRNRARDGNPKWSFDGRKIGFVRIIRGGNRDRDDIYVMNANGSGLRNLTRDVPRQAFGIAWSPAQK